MTEQETARILSMAKDINGLLRELDSVTGKLGGLSSLLHKYADQAGIPKASKVQSRVRLLLLRYQQAQLEIKALELQLRDQEGTS